MKNKTVLILSVISYYTGIDYLFYFLNRKAKRIITFHNVMPAALMTTKTPIGYTDTEESFAMKLKEIRKHFRISTDIMDNESLTITFDDGYRNEYEIAKKILGEDKAIIFVSGKLINNSSPADALVVDLLMQWTELVPAGKYSIDYSPILQADIEISSSNRQKVWQNFIWPSFVKDADTKGYGLLKAMNKAFSIDDILGKCSPEYLCLRLTGFATEELDVIRKDGWVVGWHTQEHFPLSKLSSEVKQYEIADAAPDEMKGMVLSYPYGETQSVDEECLKIAEEAGYTCAVSNLPDDNAMTGKYFLPRFTLPNNKYLLHFELSGAKYFLKNRRIMPNYE